MKVRVTKPFRKKLNEQIQFVAEDKPEAAKNFKGKLINQIPEIPKMPYKKRISIFFDREAIRDLIFKGYVIVYKVNEAKNTIEVFGFTKWGDSS